jgi:hypothetical protein
VNRRGFLGALAGIAATAVVDPEVLLWKPTKTIFIPPPGITLRFVRAFDPIDRRWINRLDALNALNGFAFEIPFAESAKCDVRVTGPVANEAQLFPELQRVLRKQGFNPLPSEPLRLLERDRSLAQHKMIGWQDYELLD